MRRMRLTVPLHRKHNVQHKSGRRKEHQECFKVCPLRNPVKIQKCQEKWQNCQNVSVMAEFAYNRRGHVGFSTVGGGNLRRGRDGDLKTTDRRPPHSMVSGTIDTVDFTQKKYIVIFVGVAWIVTTFGLFLLCTDRCKILCH